MLVMEFNYTLECTVINPWMNIVDPLWIDFVDKKPAEVHFLEVIKQFGRRVINQKMRSNNTTIKY